MNSLQIENTINEIRNRSDAVTTFNENKILNELIQILKAKFTIEIHNSIKIRFDNFLINYCIGKGYDK